MSERSEEATDLDAIAAFLLVASFFLVPLQVVVEGYLFLRNGYFLNLDLFNVLNVERTSFAPFDDWHGANLVAEWIFDIWASVVVMSVVIATMTLLLHLKSK